MADNTVLNAGTGGDTIATDDIAGVKVQRVKVTWGVDGTMTDANASTPLPVVQTGTVTVATHAVTQSGTFTVQPGNTANTTAWKVDASSVAVPVTDNAGSLTVDGTVKATLADGAGTNITSATRGAQQALSVQLVDAAGSQITSFGGGTQFAEDVAHTSGDVGTLSLAVRRDANSSLVDATGDYAPLQVDATGNLKVAIISGAGSGGTSIQDAAAYTRGTTSATPIAGVVSSSAPTLTAGGASAVSMTTAGEVRVNVSSGGIAAAVEDAVAAGGEDGIMVLAVRRDAASSGVSADGDFAALSVDSTGALRVSGSAGTTQYTEDAASAGAESLVLCGAVRQDTIASSTSADGDYASLKLNNVGRLYVDASVSSVPANQSINNAQINGVTPLMGNGVTGTGSQRVTIASDNTAFTVNAAQSGTFTVQPGNTANTTPWLTTPTPATAGGLSVSHLVSAATTNATNVKASAGQLYGWYIYNSNAAARKVAFHNTAGTPTAGASVIFAIVIPPLSGANVFTDVGIPFATGIAFTTVTDLTDAGATAVAASDLIINLFYK